MFKIFLRFLSFVYLLSMIVIHVNALTSDDFCYRKELTCQGKYTEGVYTTSCKRSYCSNHNLSYECSAEYCSKDRLACVEFENINLVIRLASIDKPLNKKTIRKLKIFHQKIKICPKNNYVFDSNEICINEKGCFLQQNFRMRSGNVKLIKNIECPCLNNTGYKCGNYHCSVNNHACDAFNSGVFNSSNMRSCANGNSILEKNFSIFKL